MKTLKTIMLSVGITSLMVIASATHASGKDINESLKVAKGGQLRFKIVDGDVTFKTWSKDLVQVNGKLGDDDKELVFYNDGDDTVIKVESDKGYYERSHHGWSKGDTELEVMMPETTRLFAQSTSGNFYIQGVKAGLKAKNVSGDIDISNSSGTIAAYSSSGDINLDRCKGEFYIESVSGDVEADVEAKRFEVSTISGDMRASIGAVDRVEVESVSGDIELELALNDDGSVQGSTVSGDIELVFTQSKVNAHFDLTTGPGGDIDNRITSDRPSESWVQAEMLEFKSGNGSSIVELETVSGSLDVMKK